MFIGEVIGSVVASRKTESMQGLPLRLVRRLTTADQPTDQVVIAVDVIGADVGERVLIAAGSSARQTHLTDVRPCDAVIMAVVDTWQLHDQVVYQKATPPVSLTGVS